MTTYLVGIDVGTTGAKAMVLDLSGNVIGYSYREYGCIYSKTHWVEVDAELLTQSTFQACNAAIQNSGVNPADIAAVGFSVQRATFGLVDENNEVIGNFYVWQDNRAITEMDYITDKMPALEMYNICGQPVTPTFSFQKIIWLMRHEPEKYQKAKKFVWVSDYLIYRFGADDFYCEVTNAGCSAMLDIKNLTWSGKILDTYGIEQNKLPRLVQQGTGVGKVSKDAAQKTGLQEGTLLCTGSGDNQCGALGAGVVRAGDAILTLGTSGVLVVAANEPRFVEGMGLMVNAAATAGLYQLEGIQLGAASSYRWIRDTIAGLEKKLGDELNLDPFNLMDGHLLASPVGANGVVFMPYLVGSGYPYWNLDAKGLFAGLTFSTSRSDLIRAVMEGISLESKDMYEHMKESGVGMNSLSIVGGATKSKIWRQVIADMFNVEIRLLKVPDATVIGAAILAGIGAGLFKDAQTGAKSLVRFSESVGPIAENVEKYNRMYKIYRNIYAALNEKGVYNQLSTLHA